MARRGIVDGPSLTHDDIVERRMAASEARETNSYNHFAGWSCERMSGLLVVRVKLKLLVGNLFWVWAESAGWPGRDSTATINLSTTLR